MSVKCLLVLICCKNIIDSIRSLWFINHDVFKYKLRVYSLVINLLYYLFEPIALSWLSFWKLFTTHRRYLILINEATKCCLNHFSFISVGCFLNFYHKSHSFFKFFLLSIQSKWEIEKKVSRKLNFTYNLYRWGLSGFPWPCKYITDFPLIFSFIFVPLVSWKTDQIGFRTFWINTDLFEGATFHAF